MLRLRVIEGDLLDAQADAIVLPIDGELPASAPAAAIERSLGRIARGFAKRYPEAQLLDEIEAQVTFPLPLGQVADVELVDGPFRWALLLSTLAHDPAKTGDDALRRW